MTLLLSAGVHETHTPWKQNRPRKGAQHQRLLESPGAHTTLVPHHLALLSYVLGLPPQMLTAAQGQQHCCVEQEEAVAATPDGLRPLQLGPDLADRAAAAAVAATVVATVVAWTVGPAVLECVEAAAVCPAVNDPAVGPVRALL